MFKIKVSRTMIISAIGALVLLFAIARAVTSGPPTVPRPADVAHAARELPPLVESEERIEVPAGDLVAGNGVIEPADRETRVAGDIGGRIARIHAAEGDRVSAGDPLVELESDVESAALAGAESDLRVALAELERTAK